MKITKTLGTTAELSKSQIEEAILCYIWDYLGKDSELPDKAQFVWDFNPDNCSMRNVSVIIVEETE